MLITDSDVVTNSSSHKQLVYNNRNRSHLQNKVGSTTSKLTYLHICNWAIGLMELLIIEVILINRGKIFIMRLEISKKNVEGILIQNRKIKALHLNWSNGASLINLLT